MYELTVANKNYSSWSLRPWVLMRTLGIPFTEHLVMFAQDSGGQSFKTISPTGRVPLLGDGDLHVWDSLAITEYLAERHQGVWPADNAARAWARSATAEMHSSFSALRNTCPMSCGVRVDLASVSPALQADISRVDALWSEGLTRFGGPFLAGSAFMAVDAFFAPVTFRALTYGLKLSDAAAAYAERVRALPAMREWYEAGLAETAREPGHEAEVAQAGAVTQDLRAV